MFRTLVAISAMLALHVPASANAAAASCAEALRAAGVLAADATRESAQAREMDGTSIDLMAAQTWQGALSRIHEATGALDAIDRSTCDAGEVAKIEQSRIALSGDRDAADEKFRKYQPAACSKLAADSRAEAVVLDEIHRTEARQVYIALAMGYEYKMMWRVNFAKAFGCTTTRDLFDESREMSGRVSAALGTPKAGSCSNARKLAAQSAAADDSRGFVTYAHIALHYADCDAEELLESDAEFKDLYESYHRIAPEIHGSVYD
jgi:hypothetical protein